jgi:O-acetyl-ADP-ribose deacetylase (regulator of RNase III)
MLMYRRTSLLESTAQTLVNTVNCVGIMGKGVAREFKTRDPLMFETYQQLCKEKKLAPGKLWLWRGSEFWTLNFPTKIHWRNPSKIEWIEAGLQKFVSGYSRLGIREASFPRLGCGNGGLNWNEVRPMMEEYLSALPIDVYIHDYTVDIGFPEHLEPIASKLNEEADNDPSFQAFIESLRRALELSKNSLSDMVSKETIDARLSEDDLAIGFRGRTWVFEIDDLRGIWINLQNGLLTSEKAGWSSEEAGQLLLSILSVLPQVRPVQIQRPQRSDPELAVELRPRGSTIVPPEKLQREFAWR